MELALKKVNFGAETLNSNSYLFGEGKTKGVNYRISFPCVVTQKFFCVLEVSVTFQLGGTDM